MSSYLVLPETGGGIAIYPNPAALPATDTTGAIASVVSDSTLRQFDGLVWNVIASTASAMTIVDTDSIDLTLVSSVLSGVLRISSNAADAGNFLASANIESATSLGLRIQVPNAGVRAALSATAPVAYNNTTGVVSMAASTIAVDGYLQATDFVIFNNKVGTTRTISTTAPLTGGGDLSADRTLSIPVSTASVDGYLAAADFTVFAAKVSASRNINTTSPLTGGGNLASDLTLTFSAQNANLVFAGPSSAGPSVPTFRALAVADIPSGVSHSGLSNLSADDHAQYFFSAGRATGQSLTGGTGATENLSLQSTSNAAKGQIVAQDDVYLNKKIFKANNTTNNTFVGNVTHGFAGASATNLQTCTATFDSDMMIFTVEIGTERKGFLAVCTYDSTQISFLTDNGSLALPTDAGTGIFISKSANSSVLTFKNRLGVTRAIRVKAINAEFTATTAWV